MSLTEPVLSTLALLIVGTLLGYWPTRRLIAMREARHELKQGSASFLRAMSGWILVLAWLAVLWFGGTIIGDWVRLEDLDAALRRSELRFWFILEILASLGSD